MSAALDVHSCFVCHKSPNLNCLACPKSLCKCCIGSVKMVQIKGTKGLCSSCLSLALQVENNKDGDFDMPFDRQFAIDWMIISQKEGLAPKDLYSADDRMKENKFYISGSDLNMDDGHVKICEGKAPKVKRKKLSLLNKIPRVVAAEGQPELLRVKQEAEMEGNGIYLGDEGVMNQNTSSQHINIGSADNDGTRKRKKHSAAAKVTEGDRSIVGQNASSKIGSVKNYRIGNGKNHSATANIIKGDQGIMVRHASRYSKIGSSNNNGIGEGNDKNAAVKVTEGVDGVMGRNASSQRINTASADNDGIGKRNNHNVAAKVTEGDRGNVGQDASSQSSKFGSATNDGIGNGTSYSATANAIEGDRGIMVRDVFRRLNIGLSNDDGIGEGHDYNAVAKVTKGDEGVMGRNASSQRINIGSTDNDGTGKGNNHSAAAKVTKGDRGIVGQDASPQRSNIGSASNGGIGNEKNHSATKNVIEGDQGIMVRDASRSLEIGLSINDGITAGNDYSAGAKVSEGDEGVRGRISSSHRINFGSADNDGIGNGNNHSAAAKVTEGYRGIVGQDASSQCSKFCSANDDRIGNGKNHSATAEVIEGDQGIMVKDASQSLKIGSSSNDGIGEGNDHNAAAKVTEGSQPKFQEAAMEGNGIYLGDQGVMVRDASRHLKIGSSNNDGIGEGNDHNAAAKVIQGGQEVLDQTASFKRTKIIRIVVVNDDVTEPEIPVSSIANLTEGNKEAEDNRPTFDKQAEAMPKTRPKWYNSATEVPDQPNLAMKDRDFGWNIIVSEDGKVKGPYPLHSLKCLQDIYTVSSFLKVFKTGESTETAIPLGDALKLLSI